MLYFFYYVLFCLSVNVRNYIVERCAYRNQVGNHMALAALVHHTHQVEARALEVHAERRFATVALDVYAKHATACLNLRLPATCRQLNHLRHLSTDFAFRNVVDKLLENLKALLYFVEAVKIAVVAVAVGAHNLVKFEFAVD